MPRQFRAGVFRCGVHVSRQSSRNPQLGIVKGIFDRQLFFRQSSTYSQDIVSLSSTARQSSIVNRQSSTARQRVYVRVCTCVCMCARSCVCVCVCVCVVPVGIGAKIQTKRANKVF
jgi:hypothetical protein